MVRPRPPNTIAFPDEGTKQRRKKARSYRKSRNARDNEARRNKTAGTSNLARYNQMRMAEKIQFARNGYRFPDNPYPAIRYCRTVFKTKVGRDRGIQALRLFPYLPVGFVLLFSKLDVVDRASDDPVQSCYQSSLPGGRFLLMHTEPTEPYGLANFVNCPLKAEMTPEEAQKRIVKQNMRVAKCRYIHSNASFMSEEDVDQFPAYLKVIEKVYPGEELLVAYGAAYRY
jgi:hypothetical protein